MLPKKRCDDLNRRGAGLVVHKGDINTHKLFTEDRSGLRPSAAKDRDGSGHNGALQGCAVAHC